MMHLRKHDDKRGIPFVFFVRQGRGDSQERSFEDIDSSSSKGEKTDLSKMEMENSGFACR